MSYFEQLNKAWQDAILGEISDSDGGSEEAPMDEKKSREEIWPPVPNVEEVSQVKHYPPGTMYLKYAYPFRYAQAGEGLKADYPAYAHFEGELPRDDEGRIIIGQEHWEAYWCDLRPEGPKELVLGWPVVDVPPGHYFWLKEKI